MKRLRNASATLAMLAVLFGLLLAINPRVRESAGQISGDVQSQQWQASTGSAAASAMSMTSYYASDNPYLFSFLLVAGVLFVLMLRT